MRTVLMIVVAVLSLTACDEQKRDVKDTVFAPQIKALEKARAVEGKVQEGAQKTRAAVSASENQGSEGEQKTPGY
jgi:hypothetical protein